MNASPPSTTDVLIVGAGPTGLVLALWLTRLGVRVRILDKTVQPGTTSRALVIHARTLELYSQVGLAPEVVEQGRKMLVANMWVAGQQAARAVLGDIGAGLSPFPYALILAQDEHERLLIDHLSKAGIRVERQTELVDFAEEAGRVVVRLRRPDSTVETCAASYLAGCDGAHSTVRDGLGIGFPGGTYSHLFYVADVEARGATANGELHVAMDTTDFLVVFPLKADGRARLIGTVRESATQSHDDLTWNDVSKRVIEWIRIDVRRVNWFSTYRVHHRVADQFRKGRAFLLGDAGHIHSPVGGQGMNTGIGDAINLAWKLAAVVYRRAPEWILETYEPERIAFARRLVATTDRAFTAVTSDGMIARTLRLHVAPTLIQRLFALKTVRQYMFRTVSQTLIDYRESRLSEGQAGTVHGGDRLPWVTPDPGADAMGNFAPLASSAWQVHVYGETTADLGSACEQRQLSLHPFPWTTATARAGLRRDAAYLVRPDGYVALADPAGNAKAITSFLDARTLIP
ncbi:MAG TPA: FAD-dependent monooxygenase [Vicinamibacterales bacterium]|jgi:2-polyprenyl-6-methoxyphenol hydroxylase-like FAD-dependent oxidoreductase